MENRRQLVVGRRFGVEGLSKKEKGSMDMGNSDLIAGGGCIRGLNCNGKKYNRKRILIALAGVAQWIECGLQTKGSRFDSQSGHMPGFQTRSPVGGM